MTIPSRQTGWDPKTNLLWQISKQIDQLIKVFGKVDLSPSTTTTTTTTAIPLDNTLTLTFDDIANASLMIGGDATNVSDWNVFFDLPAYGTPFSSVAVNGNSVELSNGGSIAFREYVFGDSNQGSNLLEVVDTGCVTECKDGVFSDYGINVIGCFNLTKVHLPNCIILEKEVFADCIKLNSLILPFDSYTVLKASTFNSVGYEVSGDLKISTFSFQNVITVYEGCFCGCKTISEFILPSVTSIYVSYIGGFIDCSAMTVLYLPSCINFGETVGNDAIFYSLSGQTITLTVPPALLTCNGGQPDGDIQYLQANNTVTIIQV